MRLTHEMLHAVNGLVEMTLHPSMEARLSEIQECNSKTYLKNPKVMPEF